MFHLQPWGTSLLFSFSCHWTQLRAQSLHLGGLWCHTWGSAVCSSNTKTAGVNESRWTEDMMIIKKKLPLWKQDTSEPFEINSDVLNKTFRCLIFCMRQLDPRPRGFLRGVHVCSDSRPSLGDGAMSRRPVASETETNPRVITTRDFIGGHFF